MLTICKSDIFATVLSEMPLFYTTLFICIYRRLHLFTVKIGICAVKLFLATKCFFIILASCA